MMCAQLGVHGASTPPTTLHTGCVHWSAHPVLAVHTLQELKGCVQSVQLQGSQSVALNPIQLLHPCPMGVRGTHESKVGKTT